MNNDLSIQRHNQALQFLEDYRNELHAGDMQSDNGEIEKQLQIAIDYLEAVRSLYWNCAKCGRLQSPNKETITVNEESYCSNCVDKGI